jgi:hypothetical protein
MDNQEKYGSAYTEQKILCTKAQYKKIRKPTEEANRDTTNKLWGWDLIEWLERCASIPMITSSNPSSGSQFTFRSDLLLTARGGCT